LITGIGGADDAGTAESDGSANTALLIFGVVIGILSSENMILALGYCTCAYQHQFCALGYYARH